MQDVTTVFVQQNGRPWMVGTTIGSPSNGNIMGPMYIIWLSRPVQIPRRPRALCTVDVSARPGALKYVGPALTYRVCGSYCRRRFLRCLWWKNYYISESYSHWLGCYVFFSSRKGTPMNCKSLVTLRSLEPAGRCSNQIRGLSLAQLGFFVLFLPLSQLGPMLVIITVQNGVHGDNFLLGGGCSWTRRVRVSLVGIFDFVCLLHSRCQLHFSLQRCEFGLCVRVLWQYVSSCRSCRPATLSRTAEYQPEENSLEFTRRCEILVHCALFVLQLSVRCNRPGSVFQISD
jgi:hypothetical protein